MHRTCVIKPGMSQEATEDCTLHEHTYSCCIDPCVRGGMCVNCGEWINDDQPHVGGTTPQGDNEG